MIKSENEDLVTGIKAYEIQKITIFVGQMC